MAFVGDEERDFVPGSKRCPDFVEALGHVARHKGDAVGGKTPGGFEFGHAELAGNGRDRHRELRVHEFVDGCGFGFRGGDAFNRHLGFNPWV